MSTNEIMHLTHINNATYRAVDLPLVHEYNRLHNLFFATVAIKDSNTEILQEVSTNAICKYKCLCELERCRPHTMFVEYLERVEVRKQMLELREKQKKCEKDNIQEYSKHYGVNNAEKALQTSSEVTNANGRERNTKNFNAAKAMPISQISSCSCEDVNKNVSTLIFDRTYIGERALLPILMTLSLCTFLRKISLREQRMNSFHVEMLSSALKPLPLIANIDVSYNPCGTDGVAALLHLVVSKASIVECKVDGINAVAGLVRRLEAALSRNALRVKGMPINS